MTDETPANRPWTRRDDETDAQWQGFRIYRNLGLGRTVEDAWEKYAHERGLKSEKAPTHFWEWVNENDWRDRVEAFDKYQDEQHLAELREIQREAMQKLMVKANKAALVLGHIATGEMGKLREQIDNLDEVTIMQIRAIKDTLDRLGITTPEEVQVGGSIDLTSQGQQIGQTVDYLEGLSDEELQDEIGKVADVLDDDEETEDVDREE